MAKNLGKSLGVLCDKIMPGEMQHYQVYSVQIDSTTDRSMGTTKAQLSEPMSFIRVT